MEEVQTGCRVDAEGVCGLKNPKETKHSQLSGGNSHWAAESCMITRGSTVIVLGDDFWM